MLSKHPIPPSHPVYRAWAHMKGRCDNPKDSRYNTYGGRGITYDPKWADFSAFYSDMFPTWKEGLTLERRDNDKGYYKSNCLWDTRVNQARNRTTSKLTKEQAQEIRKRFKPGLAYQEQLAAEFGISSRMVRYIASKGAWA